VDEKDFRNIQQLALAFRALDRSVEKSLMSGMGEAAGDTAVTAYNRLQARAALLLPDDFYITEVLQFPDDSENEDGDDKLAQVHLLASQALDYLEGLARAYRRTTNDVADIEDVRGLGRDLQEQIATLTRNTLRRALGSIDLKVEIERSGTPPTPPAPPEAPSEPEKRKRDEDPLG
jgi:hypothetical protein